ncbi:MAG: helix-turn-helix transcriptional regulator [Solirubrobacteraceae bacterium]|nr:helix-turn-helix transcriptional regulator [Solirubrobacteraceae bacterium]
MNAPKTLAEIRAQRTITPQMREQIAEERELLSAEIALHDLRERAGVSQSDLAERLQISRPRVSAIERNGEDLRLSTIGRYVEALGGRMRLVATINGEDIDIVPSRTSNA